MKMKKIDVGLETDFKSANFPGLYDKNSIVTAKINVDENQNGVRRGPSTIKRLQIYNTRTSLLFIKEKQLSSRKMNQIRCQTR